MSEGCCVNLKTLATRGCERGAGIEVDAFWVDLCNEALPESL